MPNYIKSFGLAVLALSLAGCSFYLDPSPQLSTAEPAKTRTEEQAAPTYTDKALDYLLEVGVSGFEFGGGPEVVYKWTDDILVEVAGSPSDSDLEALDDLIDDLTPLIVPVKIRQVESGGNMRVWYGPDSEFSNQVSNYVEGNRGYFSLRMDSRFRIRRSDILISTEMSAKIRAHLLREELTQSLGLVQDSWTDKESIFYQGWTSTTSYTEMDQQIIKMLYDVRVKPGMSRDEVKAIFS